MNSEKQSGEILVRATITFRIVVDYPVSGPEDKLAKLMKIGWGDVVAAWKKQDGKLLLRRFNKRVIEAKPHNRKSQISEAE